MLPLLSLHAIATRRGDGLHPVLLAGLKRLAAACIEHVVAEPGRREHEEGAAEPAADGVAREEIAKPPHTSQIP